MRNTLQLLIAVALCSPVCNGQSSTSRISDLNRAILAKQRSANPYEGITAAAAEDKEQLAAKKETIKLSERLSFLTDGRQSVAIPKGAVLYVPKSGNVTIEVSIKGKLVEWNEFLLSNRNAVRLEPVDISHLQGKETVTEEAMENISKRGILTLSAYQGRIVALPKVADETSTTPQP